MNLEEALQINYELAELAIQEIQNLNSFSRSFGKDLSEQLREIQLKSSELSVSIQYMRVSIDRNISTIDMSERLDSKFWVSLMNSMELQNFILSRVELPNIPITREAIERINNQILGFQGAIQPQIANYNRSIQILRSYRSRPFSFGGTFGLPRTDDLPVVLNTAELTIF
jgi:hypothetical protein